MARITSNGYCNFDTTREPVLFDAQGGKRTPAEVHRPSFIEGRPSSAGTSSLTSESKQEQSGSSHQETDQSTPSPAQTADSHSNQDQQSSQAQSDTAPSMDGNTQETGQDQARQQDSSEDSAQQNPATPGTTSRSRASGNKSKSNK